MSNFLMNPYAFGGVLPSARYLGNAFKTGATTHNLSVDFDTNGGDINLLIISMAGINRDVSSVIIDPSGANVSCSKEAETNTGTDFDLLEIWKAVGYAGTGVKTVRVTLSGSGDVGVEAYAVYDLVSTTKTDSGFQGSVSATSASCSLDVSAGGVIIAGICKTGTSNISMTNVTEDTGGEQQYSGTKRMTAGWASFPAGATGQSVSASWTTADNGRMAAVSYR